MSDYPEIAARFARDTARHQMIVLHDDGLYRHLRFTSRPQGYGEYWFDLITWPGRLAMCGDLGDDYVFSRMPDMFEFFRADRRWGINPHYWAEKLGGGRDSVREFQEDLFVKLVWEQVDHLIEQEYVEPEQADRFRQAIKDDIVEGGQHATADEAYRTVEEFAFYNDPSKEFDYRHEADVQFNDAWEWFSATKDYESSFIWACYAIQWGIARYDRVRKYGLQKLATPAAVS